MKLWFLAFVCVSAVTAQNLTQDLQLAKALERDGQLEKALTIYQRLFSQDSTHLEVIDRLKNTYKALGYHDARLRLVQRIVARDSMNIPTRIELVDAYCKSKKNEDLQREIRRILILPTVTEQVYRLLASTLIENRQLDEVENVYKSGRKNLKNDALFTLEMARLQTYRGDYYEATRELIRFLNGQEDVSYLESQIGQFPDSEKETRQVIRALREFLGQKPDHIGMNRLLLRTLVRAGSYDDALGLAIALDTRLQRQGVDVLLFAEQAREASQYAAARQGYNYFLERYPNSPQAELGIAICEEGLTETKTGSDLTSDSLISESQKRDEAILRYDRIAERYPSTEWSAEALMRAADLQLNRYFDTDQAMVRYRKLVERYPRSQFRFQASMRIAEGLVIKNDLPAAIHQLKSEPSSFALTTAQKDEIEYRLAEIYFYQKEFSRASEMLKGFTGKRSGRLVNDALELMILIQENGKSPKELEFYSMCRMLTFQRKYGEALSYSEKFIKENPNSRLADDMLFLRGVVLQKQKRYAESAETFGYVASLTASPLCDRALLQKAQIEVQYLQSAPAALKTLRDLLTRFPSSIYSTEARKLLRELEAKNQSSS